MGYTEQKRIFVVEVSQAAVRFMKNKTGVTVFTVKGKYILMVFLPVKAFLSNFNFLLKY